MAARLKPIHRSKALALLARGLSIPQCTSELQRRYHSEHTLESVRRAYFQSHNVFDLTKFEGAPRETILAGLATIRAQRQAYAERSRERMLRLNRDPKFAAARNQTSSKTMHRLHQDPEFAARRDERGRKRLLELHQDPAFRTANAARSQGRMRALRQDPAFQSACAERLRQLNQDPTFIAARNERLRLLNQDPEFAAARAERARRMHQDPVFAARRDASSRATMLRLLQDVNFRAKMQAGLERFWQDYRARKSALTQPHGWEEEHAVPVEASTEEIVMQSILHDEIGRAASVLTPAERRAVSDEFGLELPGEQAEVTEAEHERTLRSALNKLRRDERLRQLFEEE